MYIDYSISIPKKLPSILKEDIEALEKAYEKNDELTWDLYIDGFEASVKQFYCSGYFTKKEALQLMSRYGI